MSCLPCILHQLKDQPEEVKVEAIKKALIERATNKKIIEGYLEEIQNTNTVLELIKINTRIAKERPK